MNDRDALRTALSDGGPCFYCQHGDHDHHTTAFPRWCGANGCHCRAYAPTSDDYLQALVEIRRGTAPLSPHADDPSTGHIVSSQRARPVTISEADFGPVHGAQADDPSGPAVDAAWEALVAGAIEVRDRSRDTVLYPDGDEGSAPDPDLWYDGDQYDAAQSVIDAVARHRPLIEAAIRAEKP